MERYSKFIKHAKTEKKKTVKKGEVKDKGSFIGANTFCCTIPVPRLWLSPDHARKWKYWDDRRGKILCTQVWASGPTRLPPKVRWDASFHLHIPLLGCVLCALDVFSTQFFMIIFSHRMLFFFKILSWAWAYLTDWFFKGIDDAFHYHYYCFILGKFEDRYKGEKGKKKNY